jgi:hypothetical protein
MGRPTIQSDAFLTTGVAPAARAVGSSIVTWSPTCVPVTRAQCVHLAAPYRAQLHPQAELYTGPGPAGPHSFVRFLGDKLQ